MTLESGEREARMHLLAGAIGSYKNLRIAKCRWMMRLRRPKSSY